MALGRTVKCGLVKVLGSLGAMPYARYMLMRYRIRRTGSPVSTGTEQQVASTFVNEVQDGDVVWDVGAMGGMYSMIARAAARPKAIHAFEPSPQYFTRLTEVVEALPGRFEKQAHQVGLGSAPDKVLFAEEMPEDAPTAAGAIITEAKEWRYDPDQLIEVDIRTGDSVISNGDIPPPDVVKIDVEGAEYDVLRGLETTIAETPPRTIFIEIHSTADERSPSIFDFGSSPMDVHEYLEQRGYSVEVISNRDRDYHIKAKYCK